MHSLRAPLGVLLAATLLAACGGSTPAATSGTGGGTAATGAPAATSGTGGGAATAEASTGTDGGGINLGGAVTALDDLDNFAFRMEMKASGASEFMLVPKEGSLVMEGTVILKPTPAADITMTTSDGTASPSAMGIRLVDNMSYVNLGGDQWMGSPVTDMDSEMSSYKPENLLGGFSSMSGLSAVGDETKNGIATTHYKGEDTSGLASTFGLPDGSWTTDVWIAKDGGYVVSESVLASAKAGAEAGTFTMTIDLTKANDPSLKVEKPANVMEIPSTAP
jgi:hypothetical protein